MKRGSHELRLGVIEAAVAGGVLSQCWLENDDGNKEVGMTMRFFAIALAAAAFSYLRVVCVSIQLLNNAPTQRRKTGAFLLHYLCGQLSFARLQHNDSTDT